MTEGDRPSVPFLQLTPRQASTTLASYEAPHRREVPLQRGPFRARKSQGAARIYKRASLCDSGRTVVVPDPGIADFSFTPTAAILGM